MNLGLFEVLHQVVHVPRNQSTVGPADWISNATDLSSVLQEIGTLLGQLPTRRGESSQSESKSPNNRTSSSYGPSYVILWLSRNVAYSASSTTTRSTTGDSSSQNVKVCARQVATLQASVQAHLQLSRITSHQVVVQCLPDPTTHITTPTASQIVRLYESLPEDAIRGSGATATPFPDGTVNPERGNETSATASTSNVRLREQSPTRMVGPAFSLVPAPWPGHRRSSFLQFNLHWPLVVPRDQVATLHVAYARSRSLCSLWIALIDEHARHWDIHCAPLSPPSSGSTSSTQEVEHQVVKAVWEYTKRSTIQLGQRLSMLAISALDPINQVEHGVWQTILRTDRPAWAATTVLLCPFQRINVHIPLQLSSGIQTKPVPNDPPASRFGLTARPKSRTTKPTTSAGEVLT